jgi:superfamily II DNA or RNA helicase
MTGVQRDREAWPFTTLARAHRVRSNAHAALLLKETARLAASMTELRPYQRQCLERLRQRYREGKRRMLVSLPTGTGKTVIFAQFPHYFRMKKRLLVLAHREELLEQALQKFHDADPTLPVEIEQAGKRASANCKVVIASVATIGRAGSTRLAALDPEDFYLIVVDEAHHSVAKTYRAIFEHFKLFAADTPRMLVGFTATPRRGDQQGLGEIFEEIAYSRSLEEMIRGHFLCPVAGWRVASNVDLDGVQVKGGDFVESQLARVVDVAERNALLLRAYQDLAPHRRCIVFCVNVAHAQDVAARFLEAGIRAAAVWGAMPKAARRATLAELSSGALEVVTNCNVLTEGFDEPRIDCILMGRPTRSRLLYAQMVGRGTRLHSGKSDLLVIDVADNSRKHTLAGLHALFDLNPALDLQGSDALMMADRLRAIAERYPWVDTQKIKTPRDLELVAERIDLFRFTPPDEVQPYTRLSWCATPGGGYRLGLPHREQVVIQPNLLDAWEVTFHAPDAALGQGQVAGSGAQRAAALNLGTARELPDAIRTAEAFVQKQRAAAIRILDLSARWRDQPPSDAQRALLQRKGVPIPKGLTRGQASWMIGLLAARGRAG